MTLPELLSARLSNQLLAQHNLKELEAIVAYMGAMQAQSFDLAKWAIGSRLENQTINKIEESLNTGHTFFVPLSTPIESPN